MSGKRNASVCRGHELANALYLVTVIRLTLEKCYQHSLQTATRLFFAPNHLSNEGRIVIIRMLIFTVIIIVKQNNSVDGTKLVMK